MTKEERRAQREAEMVNRLDRDALQDVLQTRSGRWFIMRLFDSCHVFERTMTGNSWTYFNEGARDMGLQLRGRIIRDGHVDALQLAEREYVEKIAELQKLRKED
nr:MAG TPA: hypothetical protein [Caudoviricetes sp.]